MKMCERLSPFEHEAPPHPQVVEGDPLGRECFGVEATPDRLQRVVVLLVVGVGNGRKELLHNEFDPELKHRRRLATSRTLGRAHAAFPSASFSILSRTMPRWTP